MGIDPELKAKVVPELRSGEDLLWAGKPTGTPTNNLGWMGTLIAALFCIIGLGVIIFMLITANYSSIPFMLLWTGIAAYNLYTFSNLLFAPKRQTYAITNERGLIIEHFRGHRVATLDLSRLRTYELNRKGQAATLTFGAASYDHAFGFSYRPPLNAFHLISDYKLVEKLIQDIPS